MIRCYAKIEGKLEELDAPQTGCWMHISPPIQSEELIQIAEQSDIPIDWLTDPLDFDERSRYERYEDVRLIVINTPVINEDDREVDAAYVTVPIGIILGLDHILTISPKDNPVMNLFLEDKVKNFDPVDVQLFVLQLFEQNVYRFLSYLNQLNLKRNHIEKELYNSSRNKELKQLLSIEKSLVFFVNTLSSNELLKMKMKRTDFLKLGSDEYKVDLFEDIIIDNSQALEMANVYTNILNGTMEAYASIISNNLNVVIQRLTLITIILMVPTLIASFYGMNVPLPFSESRFAVWFIVFFSLVFSLLLGWWFRRKRLF